MVIAFSALLLVILLLPGFILQVAYTKGFWRWNSPTVNRPLGDQILSGVVWAGLLHLIWATLCVWFISPIDLNSLLILLLGNYGKDSEHLLPAIRSVTNSPIKVSIYFLTLYAFSGGIGVLAHSTVRKYKYDKTTKFFRFNNEWYYWLKGEITEFKETTNIEGEVVGVYLTTIVHHDEDFLYRGYVIDFFFDKDGNLDRVILENASRRRLSDDRKSEEDDESRFYKIDGAYFILRYSEMSTINLKYITRTKVENIEPDIVIDGESVEVKTWLENYLNKPYPPEAQF